MYILAERTPAMGHTGWVDANRELHRETDGDAEYRLWYCGLGEVGFGVYGGGYGIVRYGTGCTYE